jgi:nucleoside-diphosphate-sugar epimerase
MDFTLSKYKELLQAFLSEGYKVYTVEDYLTQYPDEEKVLVLRHDVDEKPENALKIAQIEFDKRDIVRHSLVQKIVEAYERDASN